MSVLKDIARYFGFSNDTRVTISAPGVDVVITGRPDKVSYLLEVVKGEMERSSKKRREKNQIVQPTELDEMDSPYVLPEGRVLGGDGPQAPASDPKQKARAKASQGGGVVKREIVRNAPVIVSARIEEPPTLLPESEELTPEGEATAVQPNPSGPARVPTITRSGSVVPRAGGQAEIATLEVNANRPRGNRPSPAEDLGLSEFNEVSESDIQKI